MNKNTSVRLLVAAGVLMLLSGCISGFTLHWCGLAHLAAWLQL